MTKEKVKQLIRDLPEHKKYIDVFTAILTVPIMLTVIITNFSSLKKTNAEVKEKTQTPSTNTVKETVKIIPIAVEVTLPPQNLSEPPITQTLQPTQQINQEHFEPTITPTSAPTPTFTITPIPTTEIKTATDSAN